MFCYGNLILIRFNDQAIGNDFNFMIEHEISYVKRG